MTPIKIKNIRLSTQYWPNFHTEMFKVNKKSTGKHKPSSWMESLKEITREYIEISSIHGLTYIQEPKANLFIK